MKKDMLTHNTHPYFNIKLNIAIRNDLCPLQYHKKRQTNSITGNFPKNF
jgi:hypothetical protein